MVETGLWQNGGQDLHVGLAGMLVTSYLFQKSHYIYILFLLPVSDCKHLDTSLYFITTKCPHGP